MAEPYIRKNANDLIRAADWNQIQIEAREDIEQHAHTGGEDGTPIGTAGLADGAVTAAKLANLAVTAEKIVNDAITALKLAANSVTTAKIADGSVTAAKIADGSVTAAKLAANSVTADKIADGSVTTVELGNLAVTTEKIANAAITAAKLAAGVAPDIAIAVTAGLGNGASIPVPSGYTAQECIFMVALKYVLINTGIGNYVVNCSVDNNGVVSVADNGIAVGVAFAKRGGW